MQDKKRQEIPVLNGAQIVKDDIEETRDSTSDGWRMWSLDDALLFLMDEWRPQPSFEDLTHMLYKCKEQGNQIYALRFHACMCMRGLESQSSLGNYLVSMFVEFGSIENAQQAFDRLVNQNESSWNSLIIGYSECEKPHLAFTLHEKMQKDGFICIRAHAFVALLKACTKLKDFKKGIGMHAEVARMGLVETDLYIGSTLIDMYAKCGLLAKAQQVFDKIPAHNVVSWTALLAGYAENGCAEEALEYFDKMQEGGVSPNAVTLICGLHACSCMGAISKGQEIHCEIVSKGWLERDRVGSTVIDMYAKCGLLMDARSVFDKLPLKDSVSYTSLISGYAEHGQGEDALNCFEQMQGEGLSPDSMTFVSSLKACCIVGAIDKGRQIHAEIARQGLHENNSFLGSTLIDLYAKCGFLTKAKEVFNNLRTQNFVSWTALIAGYAEHGHGETAIKCLELMQHDGVSPNNITLVCSLKACGRSGATEKAQELHAEIEHKGLLEKDLVAGSSLVDIYAKCGLLAEAKKIFDKLPARNRGSWNSLIAGCAGYDHGEESLKLLEQMQFEGVCPDAVTYVFSLKACGSIGARDKGQELHAEIARKGLLENNLLVSNTLVDMYAKCGAITSAHQVFNKLPVRDVVSWNSLISGYAQLGECENVLYNFHVMVTENIKPSTVTFLIILNACSRASTVEKGQTYFKAMRKEYGFVPTAKHKTCMVGLCGHQGQINEAVEMIKDLPPCSSDVVMWCSALSACRNWGNSETGKQAFERAVSLDETLLCSVMS